MILSAEQYFNYIIRGGADVLLEDCSRVSPLDESKLWLLRSKQGEVLGLVGMGTLGMLGALTRLGMLLRSLSNRDAHKRINDKSST